MNRGLLLRILLASVLVLQPMGAVTHAWSHLDIETHHQDDDGQANAHAACELCVAYANAGAALPSTGMHYPDASSAVQPSGFSRISLPPPMQAVYLARAPPRTS